MANSPFSPIFDVSREITVRSFRPAGPQEMPGQTCGPTENQQQWPPRSHHEPLKESQIRQKKDAPQRNQKESAPHAPSSKTTTTISHSDDLRRTQSRSNRFVRKWLIGKRRLNTGRRKCPTRQGPCLRQNFFHIRHALLDFFNGRTGAAMLVFDESADRILLPFQKG